MRFKVLIFVLASTAGASVFGQKMLRGIVVDSITLNAIPSASIRLKGETYGTITNANGVFGLRVKETDTLVITSVGYDRLELPVYFGDDIMFIRLTQQVVMLREVTIIGRPEGVKKELPSLKLRSKSMPWGGAMPNSGGGAAVNLDYFSRREREKRKLAKLNAELSRTQTYVEIVTNLEVKQELKDRFSISDSTYYQILTHFNEQHQDVTHSANSGHILNSLFAFFEAEIRYRRYRR